MSRLPTAVFVALVLATVGAFFVTQHLKVSTPLIAGFPSPLPPSIDPSNGHTCTVPTTTGPQQVDFRRMKISFYLLHRADDVDVWVVDSDGDIVATLASDHHMRVGVRVPDGEFSWNGKEGNGNYVPDGTYYVRIALVHQGRTIELTNKPIKVLSTPPHPVVTGVSIAGAAAVRGPAIISPPTPVTIRYRPGKYRVAFIEVYRTDLPGKPKVVKSFRVNPARGTAVWDGTIAGAPAPAGTYLVGMFVRDQACNPGNYPLVNPPPPGSTPHTGVTIRYLAAQPPLTSVAAGSRATIFVDSRRHAYGWRLFRAGVRKPFAHGIGRSVTLNVRLPRKGAGLYTLALRSHAGRYRTAVPLLAGAVGRGATAPVLVVLPALTWQGLNPADDDGGGLPDTLAAGLPIELSRPFARGLPADLHDEAALLAYLDKVHLSYQLTTDLALAEGIGPALSHRRGVVLDGSERWLPTTLPALLHSYVQNGGHVVSIGLDSLRRTVKLAGIGSGLTNPTAASPSAPASADVFGTHPGAIATGNRQPILVISDPLGIFSSTSGVFTDFSTYQLIAPPANASASLAGVATGTPSVTGFRLGNGTVVEIGLGSFGTSLAHNVDSQELLVTLWRLLSR